MTFKFTIDSDKLEEILTAIDVMSNKITLRFKPEGVNVLVVDLANVGMVAVAIPAEKFKMYEADETEFGFTFDELLSSLKVINKDGNVEELHVKRDETGAMVVQSNFITQTFHPLSPDKMRKSPKWISLDLPASAEILARDWAQAIEVLNLHYDYIITMITLDSKLIVEGYVSTTPSFRSEERGEFTGTVRFEKVPAVLPGGSGRCDMIESVSPATTDVWSFNSIEYILDIARAIKKCGLMKIMLGHQYPVVISVILPKSGAVVDYMVAPRVESE